MQTRTVEKARAVVGRTTAQIQNHQLQGYRACVAGPRVNPVEKAADICCLLAFFPLSATERTGFSALLERRMERAYAEDDR